MSLPSSHLLPSASFHHIGVMVMVMSFIAAVSILGFMGVKDITALWFANSENKMVIEVPAFDIATQSVLPQDQIDQDVQAILSMIATDPLVKNHAVHHPDPEVMADVTTLDIPLPAFITLILQDGRADGAEHRLMDIITARIPRAQFQDTAQWQRDIDQMAQNLKILFAGMAICVMAVTIIIITATIRTHLKAHADTIALIHLMGAHRGVIAGLFQRSIMRSLLIGAIVGLGAAFFGLSPFLGLVGITPSPTHYAVIFGGLLAAFTILGLVVTRLTVLRRLWTMP